MNIAICEDREQDARRLCDLLARYREARHVDFEAMLFRSSDDLLRTYTPGQFQIIFMDIYMDGVNGMEAAKRIRRMDAECALIFTTVSREHALDGFEVRATHYLAKPLDYAQIDEAMQRCRMQIDFHAKSIVLTKDGLPIRVRVRDIRYAEVYGKNCILHMVNEDLEISLRINELEHRLGGEPFLRCHRSYIVNLDHVQAIEEHSFLLSGGGYALIPVRNFKAVQKAFHAHNFANMQQPRRHSFP